MGEARAGMRLAGELACQKNSYLRKLLTKVVACVEAKSKEQKAWAKAAVPPPGGDGKPTWYAVQLEDTVLFPEGGGQPFDTGRIGDAYCGNVQRQGLEVWHLADRPVAEGAEVEVEVDWERRLDQMQQHTAQHMLTAVFEAEGLETMCWGMGPETSYIQLPTATLSDEQIRAAEEKCNAYIREGLQTTVSEKPSAEVKGVPADAAGGTIRVVTIPGVDEGPCCGTHVASLAHLQALKLLHFEPKGNTLRLFFAAGGRVLRLLDSTYHRERRVVKLMGTAAEDLEAAIQRTQKNATALRKAKEAALEQLAPLAGAQLAAGSEGDAPVLLHRNDDGDMKYMMGVADAAVAAKPAALVVCAGEKKPTGEFQMLIVCSSDERLKAAAAAAQEHTGAKGGVNKGKWRGKVPAAKGFEAFCSAVRAL